MEILLDYFQRSITLFYQEKIHVTLLLKSVLAKVWQSRCESELITCQHFDSSGGIILHKKKEKPYAICPHCQVKFYDPIEYCPGCGYEFSVDNRGIDEKTYNLKRWITTLSKSTDEYVSSRYLYSRAYIEDQSLVLRAKTNFETILGDNIEKVYVYHYSLNGASNYYAVYIFDKYARKLEVGVESLSQAYELMSQIRTIAPSAQFGYKPY